MKITLRAHHLLCLKGFQGYGYDENFTENMININNKYKNNETTIFITNKADDICIACPNLKNNICKNELKNNIIIKMDNAVLDKLNAKKEYNSKELFNKVDKIFNSKENVSKICFNCIWHDKCLFYQNLLKKI